MGTLQGLDNSGSAKRVTVMYFTIFLLTSILFVYEKAFTVASLSANPTVAQIAIVEMYTTVLYSILLTIWVLLGLATVETIISIIKLIRGVPDKKEEVK